MVSFVVCCGVVNCLIAGAAVECVVVCVLCLLIVVCCFMCVVCCVLCGVRC